MPSSFTVQPFTIHLINKSFKRGEIYSWAEINQIHRVRMGIYQKNGVLISLLTDFGLINRCYPDKSEGDKIYYTGNGRRGNQTLTPGNEALLAAIASRHSVPLFNKLKPGEWRFEGCFRVVAGEYVFDDNRDRMIWRFILERYDD